MFPTFFLIIYVSNLLGYSYLLDDPHEILNTRDKQQKEYRRNTKL